MKFTPMSVATPTVLLGPLCFFPMEVKYPNQTNKTVWLSDYHIFPTLYCAKKTRKALDPVMGLNICHTAETVASFARSCCGIRLIVRMPVLAERRFPGRKHNKVKIREIIIIRSYTSASTT